MTATRSLLMVALLLAGGLAGCVGDDGSPDEETGTEPASVDEPSPANETEEADVERTWTNETFEGQLTGVNGVVVSATNGDTMQTFTAETGIDVVYLNLTADGGAVQMTIGGPDCDVSGNQIPPCAETVTTSGGEASYVNETPAEGEWQLRFSVGDPAGAQVSYTVDVVQGVNATAER